MPVLAIDLGGTKLATAVVDSQGRILSSRKEPVVRSSPGATVDQIAAECNSVVASSGVSWDGISRVGLIVPGVAAPDGRVWAPNLWGNAEIPLASELSHWRRIFDEEETSTRDELDEEGRRTPLATARTWIKS